MLFVISIYKRFTQCEKEMTNFALLPAQKLVFNFSKICAPEVKLASYCFGSLVIQSFVSEGGKLVNCCTTAVGPPTSSVCTRARREREMAINIFVRIF